MFKLSTGILWTVVCHLDVWDTVLAKLFFVEEEIYFIKRVDKGRITTVKDLES